MNIDELVRKPAKVRARRDALIAASSFWFLGGLIQGLFAETFSFISPSRIILFLIEFFVFFFFLRAHWIHEIADECWEKTEQCLEHLAHAERGIILQTPLEKIMQELKRGSDVAENFSSTNLEEIKAFILSERTKYEEFKMELLEIVGAGEEE